jgi:hypothetical protein
LQGPSAPSTLTLNHSHPPPRALLLCCAAAYAGHTILANAFPWSQGGYDALIAKQLEKVSEADKKKAEGIAVPIAVALLKER